ncbi:hypothetical protein [Actinosynnema sp. ALI-1.44]|uniref:hypothetical protein n=1 Tax=Actinosynnema sp. ALI-1.44 TaxID=1933779 RepID=UPI00143CD5D6|nr:hypothetical protein [Actinosynnema sp. ALI-1.44]
MKHLEVKRNWWTNRGTTACGITYDTRKSGQGGWFESKCPVCEQVRQQSRR